MYCYVYDPEAIEADKKSVLLSSIQQKLLTLDIQGMFIKLQTFQHLPDVLDHYQKRGAHTFVAIGNDGVFYKLLNSIRHKNGVTFGFIPTDSHSTVGHIFGLSSGEEACEIVSKRQRIPYTLGKMNDQFLFVKELVISGSELKLKCDETYTINLAKPTTIEITYQNLMVQVNTTLQNTMFLKDKEKYTSHFQCKTAYVFGKKLPSINYPNTTQITLPLKINVDPNPVTFIMGRDRQITSPSI